MTDVLDSTRPEPGRSSDEPLFTPEQAAGMPGHDRTLDPDDVFAGSDTGSAGYSVVPGDRRARFDGDTSELPAEACWTLQELVGAPHISEGSKHWPVVLQYEDELRSRLSELGLLLEIDYERRFAFTSQADDPGPRSRKLLRAKTLSLAASALALHLYQQYLVSADEPIVETSDLLDHMLAYKPAADTDEAGFEKKVRTAIITLEKAAIIKRIGDTERFVVHSVITSIITAEQVTALDQRYKAIARGETTALADQGSDSGDSGDPDHPDDPDDSEQGEFA